MLKVTPPIPSEELQQKGRPKVHLVASTKFEEEALVEFFEPMNLDPNNIPFWKGIMDDLNDERGDIQALVEVGGRLCYMSFDNPSGRTNEQYIGNIKNQKHFSVLEHGTVTFLIENVDRALTHELIRHRHLSPSELSQRYVDRATAEIVVPPLFRSDPELARQYNKICSASREAYKGLVELTEKRHPGLSRKQVREAARRVLPEGLETKIMMTGNMRAWLEMLTKRYSTHADASILELAEEILVHLKELVPPIFGDVELQTY